MKAHPEAEKFRKRSLVHYDILHELCTNISTTREYALTSTLFSQSDSQFLSTQPTESQTSVLPAIRSAKSSDWKGGGGSPWKPIQHREKEEKRRQSKRRKEKRAKEGRQRAARRKKL